MIEARHVGHAYGRRRGVRVLENLDLTLQRGDFACVRGASGSGKTTLLMALGGMLHPTGGSITIAGEDPYALSPSARARFRARHIGFVFQLFHLVPYLDVADNVRLAGPGRAPRASRERALDALARVGLTHRANQRPRALSAGERQRAAIARALFTSPSVLLADEPTGNLDPDNARHVLEQLAAFRDAGGTVLLVTHGEHAQVYANRTFTLAEGRLRENAR
ncbi:MAG: ABC transporter ATP-binding protein [Planctomycetes bacterium]|nr:ABC transporter ATP-binding protein [Planctomycetota bacterium]